MSKVRCPKCNGKLKIPSKKQGVPIACPLCEHRFMPKANDSAPSNSSSTEKEAKPAKANKPSLRSLPMPAGLKPETTPASIPEAKPVVANSVPMAEPNAALPKPTKTNAAESNDFDAAVDPMMPPKMPSKKSRLEALAPLPTINDDEYVDAPAEGELNTAPPPKSKTKKPQSSSASSSLTVPDPPPRKSGKSGGPSATLPVPAPVSNTTKPDGSTHAAQESGQKMPVEAERIEPQRTVARIIKTESIEPQLTKDGKLPTLQLTDTDDEPEKESALSAKPWLVGVAICASMLLSGLLLLIGLSTTQVKQSKSEARQDLQQYYEVRVGDELKPYQIHLREAQRAYSRGDRQAEIVAYRRVMKELRAEDKDRFRGITGSPTMDQNLEALLSILLSGR